MEYDFKQALEHMYDLRRTVIEQKGGQTVEGLPMHKMPREAVAIPVKVKSQEKSS